MGGSSQASEARHDPGSPNPSRMGVRTPCRCGTRAASCGGRSRRRAGHNLAYSHLVRILALPRRPAL